VTRSCSVKESSFCLYCSRPQSTKTDRHNYTSKLEFTGDTSYEMQQTWVILYSFLEHWFGFFFFFILAWKKWIYVLWNQKLRVSNWQWIKSCANYFMWIILFTLITTNSKLSAITGTILSASKDKVEAPSSWLTYPRPQVEMMKLRLEIEYFDNKALPPGKATPRLCFLFCSPRSCK
jgi:hypothetical protein